MTPREPIFTIGHSNHSLDGFLSLLGGGRIALLADVRSAPYSRFNPQFNRETLATAAGKRGIRYRYFGRELGGRPEDRACYVDGRIRYDRVARLPAFRAGLERLLDAAARQRVAIACAEKEPLDCHRTLLVARELEALGARVRHILGDGRLESHNQAMERLVARHKLDAAGDLFRSREETIAQAIALQCGQAGFARPVVDPRLGNASQPDGLRDAAP